MAARMEAMHALFSYACVPRGKNRPHTARMLLLEYAALSPHLSYGSHVRAMTMIQTDSRTGAVCVLLLCRATAV
jgi:hypothetical protein